MRFSVGAAPVDRALTVRLNPFAAALLTVKSGLPAMVLVLAGLALVRVLRGRRSDSSNV